MRVLVTGGSGAIGELVTKELINRGHEAFVFDLREPNSSKATYIEGDITDTDDVSKAVKGMDTVINMAALLPKTCTEKPKKAVEVNIGGTVNVLSAATEHEVRIFDISSLTAFGQVHGMHAHPTYEPLGEDAPKHPLNVYGATKYSGEFFVEEFIRRHDLDASIFRFAATFGPGQGERYGEYAIISNMITKAKNGEDIHMKGGDQLTDYIYTPDIANGLVDAVECDNHTYGSYHIGSGRLVSLNDFAEVLRKECPSSEITVEGGLDFRNDSYPLYCNLDISRAKSDFGFEPRFTLQEAVQDMLGKL